jgi:DNA-3-methyladenine glycosylase
MILDQHLKIENQLFPKNFFYRHSKLVAPDLIGCYLIKKNNNKDQIKGLIVETEAYSQEEEACHGYYKITESNKSLFGKPGIFYIYKSYGIHHCLNIVTDKKDFASGVLIRAVNIPEKNERLASGPGLVTKTFGIDISFNSQEVIKNNSLYISQRESIIEQQDIVQTTRIGISKAKNIKWRWYLKKSRSVSKRVKGDRTPKFQ